MENTYIKFQADVKIEAHTHLIFQRQEETASSRYPDAIASCL